MKFEYFYNIMIIDIIEFYVESLIIWKKIKLPSENIDASWFCAQRS